MCQKPQVNARNKKRPTKRLANWRKKQESTAQAPEPPMTASR